MSWVTLWVRGGLRHRVGPLEAAQAWSPHAGKVSGPAGWVPSAHLELQGLCWQLDRQTRSCRVIKARVGPRPRATMSGTYQGHQLPGPSAPPGPQASVQAPFRASGQGEWAVDPVGAIRGHKAEGLAAWDVVRGRFSGQAHNKGLCPPLLPLPSARLCNVLML